jgi:hypothetical protein
VACPATGSCVATGGYSATTGGPGNIHGLIETLSGGTWTPKQASLPSGAADGASSIVGPSACPAVGSCVVIGLYIDPTGNEHGLIETLSGGAWTATVVPLPGKVPDNTPSYVGDVACPAVGSCVVIGAYASKKGGGHGLIETLAEGSWTPTEAMLPAGGVAQDGADIDTVTCGAPGSCVAVGDYVDKRGNSQGLIETLTEGSWTPTEAMLPADAGSPQFAELQSASCAADGSCVAVGSYFDASGNQQGLIDTEAGGTWTATEAPTPAGSGAMQELALDAVTCPSAGSCTAVGDFVNDTGSQQGVIDALSGGTWTATDSVPTNAAVSTEGSLDAVSCGSPGACVAVGTYTDADDDGQGLVEALSGGTWSATSAPLPAGAATDPSVALQGVTCSSTGACVAVGSYTDTSGVEQGLVETLSGGSWSPTTAPLPANTNADPNAYLAGVSCPAVGSCVAVGGYGVTGGGFFSARGLIETLQGGTWTAKEAPAVSAGTHRDASLASVSCPAVGSCVAVGADLGKALGGHALAETLAGGTWTPTNVPGPPSTTPLEFSVLQSVSCHAAGSCVAVGLFASATATGGDVATLRNGTWTSAPAPAPGNAGPLAVLSSVTCPTARSCVAVGSYIDLKDLSVRGSIETLGRGSPTAIAAPTPAHTAMAELGAVTCRTVHSCVAVGAVGTVSEGSDALVETLSKGPVSAAGRPARQRAGGPTSARTGPVAGQRQRERRRLR